MILTSVEADEADDNTETVAEAGGLERMKNKAGRYKDSHRPSVISSRVDPSSLQPPALSTQPSRPM